MKTIDFHEVTPIITRNRESKKKSGIRPANHLHIHRDHNNVWHNKTYYQNAKTIISCNELYLFRFRIRLVWTNLKTCIFSVCYSNRIELILVCGLRLWKPYLKSLRRGSIESYTLNLGTEFYYKFTKVSSSEFLPCAQICRKRNKILRQYSLNLKIVQ